MRRWASANQEAGPTSPDPGFGSTLILDFPPSKRREIGIYYLCQPAYGILLERDEQRHQKISLARVPNSVPIS